MLIWLKYFEVTLDIQSFQCLWKSDAGACAKLSNEAYVTSKIIKKKCFEDLDEYCCSCPVLFKLCNTSFLNIQFSFPHSLLIMFLFMELVETCIKEPCIVYIITLTGLYTLSFQGGHVHGEVDTMQSKTKWISFMKIKDIMEPMALQLCAQGLTSWYFEASALTAHSTERSWSSGIC